MVLNGLPADAELLLMIKGPLVTQAEKSSSDPRWKREGVCGAEQDTRRPPQDPLCPPLRCSLALRKDHTQNCDHSSLAMASRS